MTGPGGHTVRAVGTTGVAPLEFIAVEMADCAELSADTVREIRALESAEIIRVVDVVVVTTDDDGYDLMEIGALPHDHPLTIFGRNVSSILTNDDIDRLAGTVSPSSCAVLLVVEHLWAVELENGLIDAGAAVVTRGPIDRQAVIDSLRTAGRPVEFVPRRQGRPGVITGAVPRMLRC